MMPLIVRLADPLGSFVAGAVLALALWALGVGTLVSWIVN